KRDGQLDKLLDWNLTIDWRLDPSSNPNNLDEPFSPQQSFSDLYSDLEFKPRSWLTLESQIREDVEQGILHFAFDQLTFAPGERWSWGLGFYYLRDGFGGFNQNAHSITSTMYYRFDDNWGFRMGDYFDAADGRLQEQIYTIYRDMRSWTGAVSFRVIDNSTGPTDVTVAVTFSLKATPSQALGQDTANPSSLFGR
ncbi:MAG TPA: hypothetical protein VGF90_03305, partial [Verrucomicrobiae bacterium]